MNRQLSELRLKMEKSFDLEELQSLCFDLDIDFENLAGQGKRIRIESLLTYMENRGYLPQLLTALQATRPHVNWDNRPPADLPCPYRGLLAFREKDTAVVYGRHFHLTNI